MLKIDKLQFDLVVNGDESRMELMNLKTQAAALRKEMQGIKDQTLLGQKKEELNQLELKMEDIRASIGLTGLTMKELQERVNTLKPILARLVPGTAEFTAYQQELNEVSARMNELKGKAQSLNDSSGSGGGMIEKILGVAGGMGLFELAKTGLNYVMQAVGQVKSVIDSTESSSDRWRQTVTGLTWAWDVFKKSLATGDFSNLIKRMDEAITKGREYASVLELIEKRTQSYSVYESQERVKLEELKIAERDLSNSKEQRIQAGIDALKIEQDLMNRKISIDKQSAANEMSHAQVVTGLGEATIKNYVMQFESNQKLITQSEEYLEAQRRLIALQTQPASYGVSGKSHFEAVEQLNKVIDQTPQNVKVYSTVVSAMGKLSDEEREKMISSWSQLGKTEQDYTAESSRIKITKSRLEKGIIDDGIKEDQKGSKEGEDLAKKHSEYLIKIQQDLESTMVALQKNQKERELKQLELDYNEKMSKVKGNSDDEIKLRAAYKELYEQQTTEITTKYNDQDLAKTINQEKEKWDLILKSDQDGSYQLYQDKVRMLDALEALELQKTDLTEKEKAAIKAKYAGLKDETDTKFQDSATTFTPNNIPWDGKKDMAQRADMSGISKTDYSGQLKAIEEERDKELQIAGDSAEAQKAIWNDYHDAVQQVYLDIANAAISAFSQIVSALSGVNSAMSEYENANLKKDEDANDQKKNNLKKQLDSKVISQKQYDDAVAMLDDEMNQRKKALTVEQAKRNKELAIANAIINVAVAVTSALSAGPIIGIILAVLVAALGAIEIAYIASTPIPEGAKGRYGPLLKTRQAASGKFNVIGQDDGKLYQDVPFQPSFTGIPGKPMLVNETGNEIVIDPYTTKNLIMNYPEIINGINMARVPQRSKGQYDMDPSAAATRPLPSPQPVAVLDEESIQVMNRFIEAITNPKPVKAYTLWNDQQETNLKIIKGDNDVSK